MFIAGYVVMRKKRVQYDYKKWLGPDHRVTFDRAGIYISNHSNPLDTPLCLYLMTPFVSFLGKKEAEEIPMLGFLCAPLMQLLVDREHRDPT